MVFLSNYLVFKIVLAALGRTDYPVAGDLELKYDNANKIYLSGGSLDYLDNITLWTTIGEETNSYDIINTTNLDISNEQILFVDDHDTNTQLGYGCDIDGDYMIGGAPQDDEGGSQAGAAYIFKKMGKSWKQTAKLVASDAAASDQAAEFCEISGDYAIFGVYSKNSSAGAAYIFKRDTGAETWSQQEKLTASDAAADDKFGWGVSIDGDYAIVGAYGEDTGSDQAGAAYIFVRDGSDWAEQAKIQADNAGWGDYFGYDVTISGDYAAVGAIYEDTTASEAGSVYIFKRNGTSWTQQQQIQSSDIASNDNFGSAVAMDGDYLAVSAAYDNSNYGAVYFFKKDDGAETWTQQTKIIPSGVGSNDQAGNVGRLSISGDTVVMGSDLHDSGGISDSGAAWLFKRSGTTWSEIKKFSASDKGSGYRFGISVGVSGINIVVGSAYADQYHTNNGALYVYSSKPVAKYYINEVGKYSADVTVAGLKYKTNEVEVTGSITPYEDYKSTVQKILPSNDGTVSDNDKYAFPGISGNGLVMVIVGPYDDDTTANSGGFMVYEKVDGVWTFTQQITGVGTGSNTFGYSEEGKAVQLDYAGTRVFIGDWHSSHTVQYGGSVYIYRRVAKGNWTLEQRIDSQASPQALELGFNDVNNDGDKLMIGSFGTYNSSTDEGRVWFYTRSETTWSLQNELASPDGANTKYGSAIGMNSAGTRVVIGAHKYSSNKGRVYIWNYNSGSSSWSHDATLTGDTSSQFGWDVDMSNDGNTIVVSARGSDKVYIYDTTNGTSWTLTKEYSGYTNISSVQISGDGTTVVAGDPEGGSTQTGYSHVYIKSDGLWPSSHDKRIDSDRTSAYNGIALAISDIGDVIISGALGDNEGGTGHGAVYVYEKAIAAELKFDGYNKLSLTNTPTSTSSKLFLGSNVYDIGTLTSDLTIETPGLYKSLVYDTGSDVAYFSKVTASPIASTQASYGIQDQVLDAGTNAGYSNGDASQGGFGNSIDMSADGTRMVVGNAHYANSSGRVWLYHLESGSWVLKQTWDGGERMGSQVAMNEAGTRAFAIYPGTSGGVKIWDYTSGAWDTSASGTYDIIPGSTIGEESPTVDCNKTGDVVVINGGHSTDKVWIYRLSGNSWSQEKDFDITEPVATISGDGTRCLMGSRTTYKVYESNYSGGSWGTETEIISGSMSSGSWPISMSTDSAGETLCIMGNSTNGDKGAIYERASNGSWSASVSDVKTVNESYGTDKPAISYDGTVALFGHQWDNSMALGTGGHALLYTKSGSTWSIAQTLLNPSSSQHSDDYFGGGVALAKTSKDRFVVSALGDDNVGTSYGAIYTYTNAIPDYINYDTYNKLTLSGLTKPTSKIHALPTGAESTTTYDIGTATNVYIDSAGTYTAEMKGSDGFAIDSNVVTGSITTGIVGISAGYRACAALTSNGCVYMWGSGTSGRLGQGSGDTGNKNTPVKVKGVDGSGFLGNIKQVSVGGTHVLALANDGTLYAWGDNNEGQLGVGDNTNRYYPTVVPYTGEAISKIAAIHKHSLLCTVTNGYAYACGENQCGQVGDGSLTNRNTFTQVINYVGNSGGTYISGITHLAGGNDFSMILNATTRLAYGFGLGTQYQLSTGDQETNNHTPRPVKTGSTNLTGITDISCGNDFSYFLKSDGTVWASGEGSAGEQGDGANSNNTSAAQCTGLSNIVNILGSGSCGFARKSDGTLYVWGDNTHGQFANGSASSGDTHTPTEITSITGVEEISAYGRGDILIARKSDGSVWCWGDGTNGSIGNGVDSDVSSPTQVIPGAGPSDGGKFNLNVTPRLKFDGYNNYTFSAADTGSTYKLKYFSNTYDLGTTSTAYIANPGTYSAEIKGATNFALSSNTASLSTPSPNSQLYYPLTSKPSANIWSSTTDVVYGSDGVTFNSTSSTFGLEFTVPTSGIFTVSCNFMKTSFASGTGVIITSSTNQNSPELESSFTATSHAWRSTNVGYVNTTGLTHNTNQWYHMVWVHDKNNGLAAYLDGVKVYSYSGTIGTPQTSFIVGPNYRSVDGSPGTNRFGAGGKMSDIRIYNTAISSTEAELIYKADNKYIPKLDFDGYNKLTFSGLESGTTSNVTFDGNTYSIGTASNVYISEQGTYEAESKGTTTFALTSKVVGTISSIVSPLLHLDFETGGLVSTGLNTSQYKYGSSSLYRNDSSVTVSNDGSYNIGNTSSAKATIMLWVRPESYPSYNGNANRIVVAAEGRSESSASYKKWAIVLREHSSIDEVWQFHYPNSSNTTKKVSYTPSDVPVGTWYHVCVTIESGSLKFYIDGVDVTSSLTGNKSDIESAWAGFNDDEGFKFCKTDANYLKGWVDDFKLFNSVLTLSEITSHMNASKLSPPSLTFDGYKLVVSGINPTSSKLKYFSNTYEIGSATNIYVENTGDYTAEIGGTTDFALLSNVSSGTIKTDEPVISGVNNFGHALTYDGKLYGWGENSNGQLGVGDNTDKTVPTLCTGIPQGEVASIWTQGLDSSSRWAKTKDDRIWVTGDHDSYALPGSSADFTTFVDVSAEFGDYTQTSNNVVWASGSGRSTQVLMENGDVWSFGDDGGSTGGLGQGASPTSDRTPRKLNISNVTKLRHGGDMTNALDSSGNIWMWGRNKYGNSTAGWGPYNVPTNIMGIGTADLTDLLAVDSETVTDIETSWYTIYAITNKGTVYCTGENASGELGQGDETAKTSSDGWVKISYFTTKSITVNKLYVGEGSETAFVFADTSDGWYCWGDNANGQLGLGDTTDKSTPVKWTHVSNIKKFSAGMSATYAIAEDGKYYAWGSGSSYRRGDNDTGAISYPKYIDALPNILAPSFEFDGYDKVFVGGTFVYEFYVSVKAAGSSGLHYVNINQLSSSTMTLKSNMVTVHVPIYSGSVANMFDGSNSTYISINDPNHEVDTKLWTLVTDKELADLTFVADRPVYMPGWRITCNGKIVLNDTTNGSTSTTPSPATFTKSLSSSGSTKFTKGTTTYDAGGASTVTVSDPGTYDAQIKKSGVFTLKSETVPATKASGLYTWAFHHGNFDNAYGDGDILTARDNGRFYADTPAYTGDIGVITPVNSSESVNVSFKLNQYTQGSSSESSTTGIMLTEIDVFDDTNTAMTYGTDYRADLYRAAFADNGQDGGTGKLSDETTPYNDDGSRLDDDTLHGSGGYIAWVNGTYDASATSTARKYPYSVDDELIRLVPLTGKAIGKVQFAYKGTGTTPGWKVYKGTTLVETTNYAGTDLNTQGNQTTHQIVDAKSSTMYTFAPPSGGLTANVLMVAGGGGGGGRAEGGGGGAGGLVYTAGTTLSGAKTIVVGNGSTGGIGDGGVGANGNDTTFTDLTTANLGGGGGSQVYTMYTGTAGSGGGGNGGDDSTYGANNGSNGTAGQGNAGGDGASPSMEGGGGGGAGGAGSDASSGNAGDGGIGKFFGTGSSFTNFGDEYGDGGWFAGGGGGGNRNETETIPGGRGGGGYGQSYEGYMAKGGSPHGMEHTGGGGGGAGAYARDKHPQSDVKGHGGRGGSGIVLIQTNVAPPNGANTAVVQVGNPRRRSLPPAVNHMGSEVNRFYIIDTANRPFPEYGYQTHWYNDPPSYDGNEVPHSQGSFSPQKRADGSTSNVWYQTSYTYFQDAGSKMAQTVDAVFMPVEASQRYDVLLSIGNNNDHDIQLEMAADGTATLNRDDDVDTLLQAGTIKCFTVGKWHHIALTVDSGGNAVGYVNGYPVVSATYTSIPTLGSRGGHQSFRTSVTGGTSTAPTFRKFLTYEVSTYNFHMSPKQVLQRAAEVGLGPKLEYDGLNTLKILNTEPGSTVRLFTSNVADTSNVFIVADPTAGEYKVPEAGKYYAEIKGSKTFTVTKTIDVDEPLYQYPPVVTGTKSALTSNLTAGGSFYNNFWTMSGAPVGNGQYRAKASHATNAPGGTHASAAGLFTNGIKIEVISDGGASIYPFLHTSTISNFDITLQLPSAKTIRKYVLYPADTNAPVSTPGGSVDPTLPGNGSEENTRRPKSWVLKGSNNDVDWTTIHTVTNKPPSIYGDVHTVSSPASYQYYMLSISANNGSSSNIQLGEWQLWGDA